LGVLVHALELIENYFFPLDVLLVRKKPVIIDSSKVAKDGYAVFGVQVVEV
jgi:hypothetical protein